MGVRSLDFNGVGGGETYSGSSSGVRVLPLCQQDVAQIRMISGVFVELRLGAGFRRQLGLVKLAVPRRKTASSSNPWLPLTWSVVIQAHPQAGPKVRHQPRTQAKAPSRWLR
ncbi:hypothetical protein PGT21_035735 [Puccinia graminis f. sp. tritici]|uniref:Uncharacterized protein n=1 Tax=Puccinia graminis f. sp. tritici TaxID=56615 RepID=A0A5B0PH48_PUCGR|nr:hypothetical protein PGT21_035735 [Puccinia graminis f. sp. tritici]KAA1100326.1 hypothetical protein PGTUg99_015439 [Puccinia graminis f. sp. tritici]